MSGSKDDYQKYVNIFMSDTLPSVKKKKM